MNLFQYLFGGMKLGKLIFTLLIVFLMVGGIFYSLNDSSVNTWVKNTQKSIFNPNIGFTSVVSGWFKSEPTPEDKIRVGLNSWSGFAPVVVYQPTSKDYVVVEKCNTTDKQFYFLIKKVGTGKVSRVNVSEQEYLNLYRGEVYPYHDVKDLKGKKIAVSGMAILKIESSNVTDRLIVGK